VRHLPPVGVLSADWALVRLGPAESFAGVERVLHRFVALGIAAVHLGEEVQEFGGVEQGLDIGVHGGPFS